MQNERRSQPPKRQVCLPVFVVYLGHKNDSQGLHPVADKLQTVQMPSPQDASDLTIVLGTPDILYAKFLPNLLTVLAPLYRLLKSDEH